MQYMLPKHIGKDILHTVEYVSFTFKQIDTHISSQMTVSIEFLWLGGRGQFIGI